ncbi:MAG: hypothetical protein OXD50_01330 [Chloroflexi bacterium]|nr:hypothetical protein [Chloroflexota bacterium]
MTTIVREPVIPKTKVGASMADVVREAWLATAELDEVADAPTRRSAFMLVLEAMLRDETISAPEREESQIGSDDNANGEGSSDDLYSTPELRGDAISSYLQVPRDEVEILFRLDETEPALQLSAQKLSSGKRPATKEIALLVLAGRTALGLDTLSDDIRDVAQRYRKYDSANFLSTLQKSDEFAVLGRPRSAKRVVRLRGAGVTSARSLAQNLIA